MTVPLGSDRDLIRIAWPEFGDVIDVERPQTPTRGTAFEWAFSQEPVLPALINDDPRVFRLGSSRWPGDAKALPMSSHGGKDLLIVSMEQVMNDDSGSPQPHFQPPRSLSDLYTPVWTRGSGAEREGRCAFCVPPVWLRLKQSAYWYHLNYVHGISAATGRPYPLPTVYRCVSNRRPSDLLKCEGWCEECRAWKGVGSRTREELAELVELDELVVEIASLDLDHKSVFPHTNWFKHCQKQHKSGP